MLRWLDPALLRWTALGVVLDGLLLAPLAYGPLDAFAVPGLAVAGLWVLAIALALVPWFVHVIALPAIFGRRIVLGATAATVLYLLFAAIIIPALGAMIFLLLFLISLLLAKATGLPLADPASPAMSALAPYALCLIAAPVGAALGAGLSALREIAWEAAPSPLRRADVVGGAVGAALFFAITIALTELENQFAGGLGYGEAHVAFERFAFLTIALAACLPHLWLAGRDALSFNPRRATSVSGAAPSAPSL